ncbi:hypothetical protein AB0M58_14460 [Streptomyces bobili]|uniref:hypothetical protein n=1 Tax=Streptomyces bobili TaxID=67280 RepID=UPI00343006D5
MGAPRIERQNMLQRTVRTYQVINPGRIVGTAADVDIVFHTDMPVGAIVIIETLDGRRAFASLTGDPLDDGRVSAEIIRAYL